MAFCILILNLDDISTLCFWWSHSVNLAVIGKDISCWSGRRFHESKPILTEGGHSKNRCCSFLLCLVQMVARLGGLVSFSVPSFLFRTARMKRNWSLIIPSPSLRNRDIMSGWLSKQDAIFHLLLVDLGGQSLYCKQSNGTRSSSALLDYSNLWHNTH